MHFCAGRKVYIKIVLFKALIQHDLTSLIDVLRRIRARRYMAPLNRKPYTFFNLL